MTSVLQHEIYPRPLPAHPPDCRVYVQQAHGSRHNLDGPAREKQRPGCRSNSRITCLSLGELLPPAVEVSHLPVGVQVVEHKGLEHLSLALAVDEFPADRGASREEPKRLLPRRLFTFAPRRRSGWSWCGSGAMEGFPERVEDVGLKGRETVAIGPRSARAIVRRPCSGPDSQDHAEELPLPCATLLSTSAYSGITKADVSASS